MDELREFDRYMAHLDEGLGHADRHAGLRGYCTGLMSPLQRKSVEPMAAHMDPMKVRSRHQSLHHFVADAAWSDEQMLLRVAQWVVPEALQFATKPQIALQQIEHLMDQGAPRHCVLADAGYGVDMALCTRLSELGLRYVVGVTGSVTVELDDQDLKQDLGLGHYEGRGWRGFHHHASPSIAAYGFLLAQRLSHPDEVGGKKSRAKRQMPALPTHYKPRGSPAGAAPRPILDHHFAAAHRRATGSQPTPLPLLSSSSRWTN